MGMSTLVTLRQHVTLFFICCGLRDCEIAHLMGVKESTIKKRVLVLCDLYTARNRTHLAAMALRANLEWPT